MTIAIYRFPLPNGGGIKTIAMPQNARCTHVGVDWFGGTPRVCVWALVDPDAPGCDRFFVVVGAGNRLPLVPEQLVLVGVSSDAKEGTLHVFEVLAIGATADPS